MHRLILAVPFLVFAGCKGAPARLVAGQSNTVIVNNRRPVQLPVRVLDKAGRHLDSTGVRYEWMAGAPVSVSPTGIVKCTESGDATLRASLGSLVTHLTLLCRPVRDVRTVRMMNLVVGAPAQELPFEGVDLNGGPVTLLTGNVTVTDSTIVTIEGARVRARTPGSTDLTMRVGDQLGFASVHVYALARTPERIRPGQHLAVPVRVSGGEMHRWRIPASRENYFLAMLPDDDETAMPALAIMGANCVPGLITNSYFCLAQHEASVIVYHPQQVDSTRELRGTLAVWRQDGR
jgi:hypothetical protein